MVVHEECTRCLCTMFVHEECTSVVHRGCNTVCSMLCTVSCSMLCTEYSKGCAPSTARVVHRVQQGLCTMLLEGCAHDVCARCLCTMFVHPRVANPMHPSTTFLEETGPKHRVFDPFTGIWAKYMVFWACFSTVSAMSALDQHLTKTCESGATHPDAKSGPKCSNNGSGDTPKTGPKHRVFDPFTGIWAKYTVFWACFGHVRSRPTSGDI